MADPTPFEALCNQVTEKILKNVNHLARNTRNIIKEQNLNEIPDLINKKNFTLTSDSHLAALFIKIIQCYVNGTFGHFDEQTKANKLSKYIWQLQKGKFKESTKNKILNKFKGQFSKFVSLINEPKKFKNILIKAKTLTKSINLDKDISTKLETKQKEIEGIIAQANDFKQDLSTDAQETLSEILMKIKKACQNKDELAELHTELTNTLTKPELKSGSVASCQWDRIRSEIDILNYVNEHYKDAGFDKEFKIRLTHCHAGTISQLLKAKERIVNAYKRIDENNAAKKTRQQSSSLSSELKTPNDLPNNQLPPKPSYSPPPVPTDDISDNPPPLGSVTPNNTPTATTEQKTPSTLPRPGRPAPKSSAFYRQRAELATANGEHTPPTYQPPPAPKDKNGTATTHRKQYKRGLEDQKKKPLPPAPKGGSGTATTHRKQHKRNLRAQQKKQLPTTPPKLEVSTGGPTVNENM